LGAESVRQTLTAFNDCIYCGLYMLYIFLIFSVHCHSGKFKIDRGGTLGDSVYAVYVSILFFCYHFVVK